MIIRKKIYLCAPILVLILFFSAIADVLVVRTEEIKGEFKRFDDNIFVFRDSKGRLLKNKRIEVRRLLLDKPVKVEIYKSATGKPGKAELIKYDQAKFFLKDDKKKFTLFGMRVKRLVPVVTEQRSNIKENASGIIEKINITALEKRDNLTKSQKNALNQYKASRKQYDVFVETSSAMVAKMNNSSGTQREQYLHELRRRKNKEQPIKRQLEKAKYDLLAVFPELTNPRIGSDINQKTSSDASKQPEEIANIPVSERMPEITEDNVIILDISGLNSSNGITALQLKAVSNYEAAVDVYQTALGIGSSDAISEAVTSLKKAQLKLFEAFPNLVMQ